MTYLDGNLDSDFPAVDLLSVHLLNSLLLHFLGGQGNKAEATSLAGLATSLKLANHVAGDRAEGNFGRFGLVGSKEFLELYDS